MTDIDTKLAFELLSEIKRESDARGFSQPVVFMQNMDLRERTFVSSDLIVYLRDKGLIQHPYGEAGWTTTAQADRLFDTLQLSGPQLVEEFEECGYTFAHTRHWCGRPYCRES
jgi:hypothetical protein